MKSAKIKAVCFDMWGTLCEGGGGKEWTILQKILRANSIDIKVFKDAGIKSLLSHPWPTRQGIKDLANKLNLKTNSKMIEKGYKSWWGLVEKSKLYPETIPVLKRLKKLGVKLIIMSNSDTESVYYKLKEYNLNEYFEKIFISAKYGGLKHEGKMFNTAQIFLALPKEQILMIDDSFDHGVIPARNFGWKALWLARGKEGNDEFKIKNLEGIFEYL